MLNKMSMNLGKFNSVSYDFRMIKAIESKIRRFILDCLKYKMGGLVGKPGGALPPGDLGRWEWAAGDRSSSSAAQSQPGHQRRLEAALLMMNLGPHGQRERELAVCLLKKADSLLGWAVGGSAWSMGQGTWVLSSAQL